VTNTAHLSVSRAWRGVAALCVLIIGLLGLFAASSHLHDSVHDEADHVDHACTITLFSQGLEDSLGWADLPVTPALFPAGEIAAVSAAPLTAAPFRLPPGRGPPLC
jgi:hypothetical protein